MILVGFGYIFDRLLCQHGMADVGKIGDRFMFFCIVFLVFVLVMFG